MEALPPFRLRPEPATAEAEATTLGFEWAPADVGHRHQLGGSPTWLQGDETPACPECGAKMSFYGQLDSVNDDFVLADCGLVYVFVCFADFRASAVVQSH
jgi:hypothetical protein